MVWQLHFLISDLELEKCVLDCFWCLQTHPKALKEPKNKILIKNDFERQLMIRKLKLSKGACLVEEKNMIEIGIIVQIFCCINPNPICIRSMLQSSRLFFFISGSFQSRHPYESFCHAMAVQQRVYCIFWVMPKLQLAFSVNLPGN